MSNSHLHLLSKIGIMVHAPLCQLLYKYYCRESALVKYDYCCKYVCLCIIYYTEE